MGRGIRQSNQKDSRGELVSSRTDLGTRVLRDGRIPLGLWVGMLTGDAARVRLRLGAPAGGVELVREFTLTPRGAWFSAPGWEVIVVEVVTLPAGAVVGYAWTAEQPPNTLPLTLFEQLVAGPARVPDGASRVASSVADPGWSWSTSDGSAGAPYAIPAALPGGGEVVSVLGATYTATVPNTVVWFLEAP